tara:strand:- start:124 stop:537 length:414 start_codon:yes stop_codon:yes gene_type:complete
LGKSKTEQAAAFCYKKKKGKKYILMVTSRGSKQWILPKGWIEDDLTEKQLAALEAEEEAGVITKAQKIKKMGVYRYNKWLSQKSSVPVNVNVYSMPIKRLKKKFKERHQRKRKWVTVKKAIKIVSDKDLEAFLKKIA